MTSDHRRRTAADQDRFESGLSYWSGSQPFFHTTMRNSCKSLGDGGDDMTIEDIATSLQTILKNTERVGTT